MQEPGVLDQSPLSRPYREYGPRNNEVVGERTLGSVNPQTLTREEFESSPDLLFHGSSGPFVFSRGFDYQDMDYL
ncbi:MAG: hypothetical protein A3H88_01100 [Candidatus Blackburnbacteria bacterium RIFCSPLOWO2_02_FULL_44_9]|uniref:Uncharacterized protein n=1 Tax=Candidatus Blackburnbacteria bacterium RIFCSPHIGHO2_02_FULL_44_20 TaxID=1797516 RepID=A0A1G1V7B9_9BACT|nr:MAG: hypothetical protein A3D26_04745 [Candidatus Blackburnbacteria bacterium RIFCSPHIGHO2_02_FULL_44_20]OGY12235.1 MAG: hypothetical protein A3E16_02675 [Candidatus Blackburnbacteria bacterium RIFCSPHIGHO2_12_FULL_44_25]OGY13757.1 MAG: hypothetical protein A3A62_02655 [Candidatus Blackburnbacteria bacterium RIFCSPLOWO2_01_FULL_44_43]OGY16484.1 MAG: hypothetical protein A3H88_01100 [Candidatus Blackburnbacteria bacterium RIFCSPLOWO2_02_FULL_44_9]